MRGAPRFPSRLCEESDGNITQDELRAFKQLAKEMFALNHAQIEALKRSKGRSCAVARGRYKSAAFAAIHETAEALRDIGAIGKRTMREFDAACLAPLPNYTGRQIRKIRERENVSQPVFARYLAVSKNLVSDWERGVKKPAGPTKRLLSIVEKRGLAGLMV